jgi:hypothetical protein
MRGPPAEVSSLSVAGVAPHRPQRNTDPIPPTSKMRNTLNHAAGPLRK